VQYKESISLGVEPTKVTIPRHGIPVDRSGTGLVKYVPKALTAVYVKIVLSPTEKPFAIDVAATLRAEKLPPTVDGLKQAVLKELHHTLKDKDAVHLTVYPPGARKGDQAYGTDSPVGDVDAPVGNAPLSSPYWVEVSQAYDKRLVSAKAKQERKNSEVGQLRHSESIQNSLKEKAKAYEVGIVLGNAEWGNT
jgi:hypothetical protein